LARWTQLPALRHGNFRIFCVSQFGTVMGLQMLSLAQVWLVLELTHDPVQVGLVSALQGLPVIVLALVAGMLADRYPKRHVLLVAYTAVVLLAVAMGALALAGTIQVWQAFVAVFVIGCGLAISLPARQSFIVEMVGRENVASAVGLFTAMFYVGGFVGPALAGVIIATLTATTGSGVVGSGAAIVISAIASASVVIGLLLIRDDELYIAELDGPDRKRPTRLRDLFGAFSYLRSARPTLITLLTAGSVAVVAANYPVLVPVAGREVGYGAGEVGFLTSLYAVGSLGAALWIGLGGASGSTVILTGAALLGSASLLFGAVGQPAIWPVLVVVAGLGGSALRTATNAKVQFDSPGPVRGRVMSVFFLAFEGVSPVGGLLAGSIASLGGARAAFVFSGVAALILAAIGARSLLGQRPAAPAPASGTREAG
jgi:MFS family permease